MKAIILAPGPSLADAPEVAADLVVGVNRAAAFRPCNVWAALDTPMVRNHGAEVKGTPTLLTRRETRTSLERSGGGYAAILCEDIPCPVPRWDLYTLTAAAVFCGHVGAESVEVYGCDWTDAADWDGVEAGENRNEARWALEREIFGKVTDWLADKGTTVTRVTHGITGQHPRRRRR